MSDSYSRRFLLVVFCLVAFSQLAVAQDEGPRGTEVPNAMGTHTWFVILAATAFLAWCISYSLVLHKQRLSRKKGQDDLLQQKEALLNRITALETQKDAGKIDEQHFSKELKTLKFRLASVLDKLGKA